MTPAPVLPFPLPGCEVDDISTADSMLLIDGHPSTHVASCPDCHVLSSHVHSHYTRYLRDLPVVEQPVRLRLLVRRFRCLTSTCTRQTFVERLPDLARLHAQRTVRLTEALRLSRCIGENMEHVRYFLDSYRKPLYGLAAQTPQRDDTTC